MYMRRPSWQCVGIAELGVRNRILLLHHAIGNFTPNLPKDTTGSRFPMRSLLHMDDSVVIVPIASTVSNLFSNP